MKILFLTWKDIKHPFAWGAEKVMHEYAKGLVELWHKVTWFWYSFKWAKEKENIDWINIIRKFTLKTAYFLFPIYYKKHLKWKYDIIIDEAWWLPFLSPNFEKDIPIIFFAHHIWDKEWNYNYPFPLNKIWKQIYYWLFKQYKDNKTITVSNSTKEELISKFWYKEQNIKVIENACDIKPIEKIDFSKKEDKILFLGRLMPIKRVEDSIKAFNYFLKSSDKIKNYTLDIIWNSQDKKYVNSLKKLVKNLWIEDKVNFIWHIDRNEFNKIILKYKVILVPSIKEWFWLIVLEANSYGIPAIWYDVPWLRDSIKDWINWFLVKDGDYNKIWEKLKELLWNIELYKKISISSLDYVKSLDNWKEKVKNFEEFILNVKNNE